MGVDLHLINKLWYAAKDEATGEGVKILDYPTALMIGIVLLRHPEIAREFIDETWKGSENDD